MAAPTGDFSTYDATGNREDLLDKIYNISPINVPFTEMIGTSKAKAKLHEWQTDSLATAVTTNAQIEGDDVSGSTSAATTRVQNYCQISRKDIVISETQEVVDKAGRESEVNYQMLKRTRELMRDIESTISQNQGFNSGGATTARKTRTLESFITSNSNRNNVSTTAQGATAGASTVGAGATIGSNAATDANTVRNITEAFLKDVVQQCFASGAEPSTIMCGPKNKINISQFTGRANTTVYVRNEEKIQGAASLYASDFGDLKVVPSRFQRERTVFVLDPEYCAMAWLRRPKRDDLAKTGDAIKKYVIAEYALEIRNEAALGVIADLTTTVN
jgi:hypothetical protein